MLSLTLVPSAIVSAINVIVIAILIIGVYAGYKKGFLESGVRLIVTIVALIMSYSLKNPISVFFYTYLPFFKMKGIFEGVSVINIIIYEILAYIVTFALLMIVVNIICKITGLIEKLLSVIIFIGMPNKILGALLGLGEAIIILFFLSCAITFTCNVNGYELNDSLTNRVLEIPILKESVGTTFTAFQEIINVQEKYESITKREEYNYEALEILLKNKVITPENAEKLLNNGKINIPNGETLISQYR